MPSPATLIRAHQTLVRGAEFVRSQADAAAIIGPGANLLTDRVRIRLLGNRLRELDRFLNLLAEEVAARHAPPGHDRAAFARLRNTPNKVRAARLTMALASPDHGLLGALGRIGSCLHHCGGRTYRSGAMDDVAEVIAAGGGSPGHARRAPGGMQLIVTADTLGTIARLYRRTGDALMMQSSRHPASRRPS